MSDQSTFALPKNAATQNNTRRWRLTPPITFSMRVAAGAALLFLMTVLAIGFLSSSSFKGDLSEILLAQQYTLLTRIAGNLDQKLLTIQRGLVLSAQNVTPADVASTDGAQRFLDNSTGLQALFDDYLFLYTETGTIITTHPYPAGCRGEDYSWRDYIKDTLRTQGPVVSDPIATGFDDRPVILMLTAPVFSAGKIIAILAGSISLTQPAVLGDISKTVIGQTGYLFLVAADGKLIMHPDQKRLMQLAFDPGVDPLFDKALQGFEGTGVSIGPNGKRFLTSYKRIASTGWLIAAVYPEEEAFLPFNTLAYRFIQVLILACLIALAVVWYYTRGLARKLQASNQALETMQADAARKLTIRSQFFQEASHDFRQRLHAMQLLTHTAEKSSSGDNADVLAKLSWAVADLRGYVKSFLEFARLETTAATPVFCIVHIQDLFQKLELQFEDIALEKNVDLRFRSTDIFVDTDEKILLRMLENLTSNAIKFAQRRVFVCARRNGGCISIEVWDDGPGIPLAEREAIFEAFYQSAPYVDRRQAGIGLGLAIVRRLAHMLDYAVTVNAREGKGSVIKIFIPLERIST